MKKNILIGITGGIAAYKILDLIRAFQNIEYCTKVIITPMGTKFLSPLTLKTISNYQVFTDDYSNQKEDIYHIELTLWADAFIIAPATANTIAKINNGIADNLLTTSYLAKPQKLKTYIAPAMNTRMWDNPITQNNVNSLLKYETNLTIIPPRESKLACGEEGMGAMATTDDIFQVVQNDLEKK